MAIQHCKSFTNWYLLINNYIFFKFPSRHLACEEDRSEEAKLLVEHGAKLDQLNKVELTPLDLASKGLAVILQRTSDLRMIVNNE